MRDQSVNNLGGTGFQYHAGSNDYGQDSYRGLVGMIRTCTGGGCSAPRNALFISLYNTGAFASAPWFQTIHPDVNGNSANDPCNSDNPGSSESYCRMRNDDLGIRRTSQKVSDGPTYQYF